MAKPKLAQQEEEQALPPAPFSYFKAAKEAEKLTESPEGARRKEEQSIAALKHDKRYKLLEAEIYRRADALKKLVDLDLSKMDDAEIGKRFVVANFGAEQLLGIINYVDQLASAIGVVEAEKGEAESEPSA